MLCGASPLQFVFYNVVNPAERAQYERPAEFHPVLYEQAIQRLPPEERNW